MRITVVIPVYNKVKFLEEAVKSAINQDYVVEVILIDDGSQDGSFELCQRLSKNEIVKLVSHKDRKRKGPSASRNLGMKLASSEFIAFLDADDLYIPNRFKMTSQYFLSNPNCLSLAESTDHLEREARIGGWHDTMIKDYAFPNQLFEYMVQHGNLHLTLNGITIRQSLLERYNCWFDIELARTQDTDFIYQLSRKNQLHVLPSDRPVAYCRRLVNNPLRSVKHIAKYRKKLFEKWLKISRSENWASLTIWRLFRGLVWSDISQTDKTMFSENIYYSVKHLCLNYFVLPKLLFGTLTIMKEKCDNN